MNSLSFNIPMRSLLVSLLFLTSCKEGSLVQPAEVIPLSITSRDLVNYSGSGAQVRLAGILLEGAATDLDTLQIFSEATCSTTPMGSVLVQDFGSQGLVVDVPLNQAVDLYLSTAMSEACIFIENMQHPPLLPGSPVFSSISPTSPSRDISSPGVFGTAFPDNSTVEFFSDAACLTQVGQGPVSDFSVIGIQVILPTNATTTIHARTRDYASAFSSCVPLTDYTHSDLLSDPPVLISVAPLSPSNQSFTPTLRASTAPSTTSVALYSDPGCLQLLVDGDPADLANPGFVVNSTANSTIQIYGKSIDVSGQPSACTFLTTYTHDSLPPANPVFVSANPTSPTNQTTLPQFIGTSSVDTETITLYDSSLCLDTIGSGTKADFESTGLSGAVAVNDVTDVYGKAFDKSGNESGCTLFTSYIHNTIPPAPPLFGALNPVSPTNGSTTPFVSGTASDRTIQIEFFKNDTCTQAVGQGTVAEYESTGIQVTADANTVTSIYVIVSDVEGNNSACTFHAAYDHLSAPAPSPGFFTSFPLSPTNASTTPSIIGTADNSIASVELFDSNTCSNTLGSGTRGQYTSAGIAVSLSANSTTDIHGVATDVYGNLSPCTFITQYIHTNVIPHAPTFTSTNPLSPNNLSTTPIIAGGLINNPASELPPSSVIFFDSPSCVSQLGSGTPNDFIATGIQINVAQNGLTSIYGRAFDAAGNFSSCAYLTDYIHNNLAPASPTFLTANSASPSYSTTTNLTGFFGASSDFMNRVSLEVYTSSDCSSGQLGTGDPNLFETTGFPVTVPDNQTSSLYGRSINEVGTPSVCAYLTDFQHYDLPPANLVTSSNIDGSIRLTWLPDLTSNPSPTYSVERALSSGGPFTVIASGIVPNNHDDEFISDGVQYFYRVYASNSTGRSQYSAEANITVSAPSAITAASLSAVGADGQITLSWGGFPQNMIYKIARSSNYGGPFQDLGVETDLTQYIDTGLVNGQSYYYIVTASNPSGLSMESNMASASPRLVPAGPTEIRLSPRSSLAACGGARGLQLAWTSPSYFSSFGVARGVNKSTTNVIASPSVPNYEYCSLADGELRYFRVTANWGTISSNFSDSVGIYGTPSGQLSIFPGDGEINLSWTTPSVHIDLSSYQLLFDVYKATDYTGDFTRIATGITNTTYTDSVSNGQGGFYYVQAYVIDNAADVVFVGFPTTTRSGTASSAPAASTNLVLNEIESESRVQLSWSPPTHYNGFRVYSSATPGGPYSLVQYVTSPVVVNVPLVEGMNYFKVNTVWGSFESSDSNEVSFRDGKVLGLNLTPGASDLSLFWTPLTGVQDYIVSRSVDVNGPFSDIGVALSTSYVDTTAASGVGYYYRVRSRYSDFTEGQVSSVVSGMRTDSSAPGSVSLTVQSSTFLRVEWPAVSGASQYEVLFAGNIAGPYISRGTTGLTFFNLSGLSPQTEYFVIVRATVGMSDFDSAPASAWTYLAPSSPLGTVGDGQIDLSWGAAAGATSYDIFRSEDGINFLTIATGYPTTNYLDSTPTNGNIYFYKTRADFGPIQLESSVSLGMTPGLIPLAPGQLSVENNNTGTEIELSWASVSGTTRYNIYRSTTSGSYGAPIQSSTSTTGVTVTGLTTGTTYYFVVTALNGTQESPQSNEVTVIPQLDPPKPDAQYFDPTSIDITWSAVGGASTYSLFRSEDGVIFTEISSGLGTNSFNDNTVDPNVTYYYKYRGLSASGSEMAMSQMSDPVNLSEQPQVPLGFTVEAESTSQVRLSWTLVPSIQSYEIMRGSTSGGPYALVGSPIATDVTFVDTSVTPGSSYFYVIRSLSPSGVPSLNSVELAVDLIAGPTNLSASNGAFSIDLSWDSIPGVATYNLKRSVSSGGPYGTITNTASLSFSDTDIIADETFYYVVEGVYADGRVTVVSAEESILRSGYLRFQIPVELIDTPLASSDAGQLIFERSLTSFDSQDYDGVSSYELEVIASNFDGAPLDIALIDEFNNPIGSVTIPANTFDPTRVKAAVTPNVGDYTYRLRLDQSSLDSQLVVYAAKLLVNQINATKTKIYFPLLSSDQSPSNFDQSVSVFSTSDTTYQDYTYALHFERLASKLGQIIDYNAWEIEALVSTTGSAEGAFALRNINTNSIVEMTETRFVGNSVMLASVPFDEGVDQFGAVNEGHAYRLDLRCEFSCGSGSVNLHKAGIWVKIENLSKLHIVHRIARYQAFVSSQTDLTQDRVFVDLAQYSSPEVYFQVLAQDNFASSANFEVIYSSLDSGTSGLSVLAGSNIFLDSDGLGLVRSPALVVPSGERIMTRITPSNGDVDFRGSFLVIEVEN